VFIRTLASFEKVLQSPGIFFIISVGAMYIGCLYLEHSDVLIMLAVANVKNSNNKFTNSCSISALTLMSG